MRRSIAQSVFFGVAVVAIICYILELGVCHIKVYPPLPKCEVKAVFVSTTLRLKAFGYFLVLRNFKHCW